MIKRMLKHFYVIIKSWMWAARFHIRRLLRHTSATEGKKGISLVVTCCNRPTQLSLTLKSFLDNCEINFDKVIIIEDGGSEESLRIAKEAFKEHENLVTILNERNIGQLNSIDLAYSHVETEWIFHLEEDWNFYQRGFIEESMRFMEEDPSILFISLRAINDQNGHPIVAKDASLYFYSAYWKGVWTGFGFNPSLRRLSHYRLIGSKYGGWNKRETSIGIFYHQLGYKARVRADGRSFIKHSGDDCSTYLLYKKA